MNRKSVIAALAIATCFSVQAQEFGALPTFDIGADAISYASAMAVRQGVERQLGRKNDRKESAATHLAPRPASFSYASTGALRQAALSEFVGRLRGRDPAHADAVAEQFRQHDYDRIYRGIIAPFGLDSTNAADSLTAYTVLCWIISNSAADPAPAAVRAARDQIATRLAGNPQLATPAARARLGEEMKILFVIVHAGWQSARSEGSLRAYSDGISRMLLTQSGTDPRMLDLTASGLVKRD